MSTGRFLVLGLLLDGSASGYELSARAATALAYFWPITRSQIYAELPRLVEEGFATGEDVPQRGVPDKRVYTATDDGREAFRQWLSRFDEVAERARQPLQIQLHFAAHSTTEHLLVQLDRWEQEVRHTLEYCSTLLTDYAEVPGRALTARFAINRAEADLVWITEARTTLHGS
ncbi:PadR family transcriptional regulator [Lapillicoccus sp.]|uniref:PadR family transcriptional regulator n=1 Tax=Lapillicoccus sp. TaxID=1909287 RepID=UPI0025EC425E|nr:PadR family transcriptional regulator [Lapillicoccus sp.]